MGTLRLDGITAPDVELSAEAVGFVASETREYGLGAGEERTTTVRLAVGTSLTGQVVEAATGRALAGARVRSRGGGTVATMSASGGRESYGEAVSDAEGRFRLTGLPIGWVATVWAELEGWAGGHTPVLFRSAEGTREPVVLALVRGGWLVAHVRRPDGEPAVGVTVQVLREQEPEPGTPAGAVQVGTCAEPSYYEPVYRSTTDASGTCRVLGLPFGGRFCARARAPKLAPSETLRGIVVTESDPQARADLRLRKPAAVRFLCVDPKGAALPDVEATWFPSPSEMHTRLEPDRGLLGVEDLEPGPMRVTLTREGFLPVVFHLTLMEGETVERTARFEEGTSIEGLVVDEQGAPLAGARVQARQGQDHRASTESDAEGRFRLGGLPAGEYGLQAYPEGVSMHSGDEEAPQVTATAPGKGVKLTVRRQARVVAQFRLPAGGAKPESVMVWVSDEDGNSSGSSHEWGDGRIVWVETPGKYRVGFCSRNYAPFEKEVELAAGQVIDLGEVLLDVGLTLEGRVVDGDAKPVAGVAVSEGSLETSETLSGKDGRFVLEHLPRRVLSLTTRSDDHLPAYLEVDPARGTSFVTLALKRGGVVVGRVKTAAGGAGAGLGLSFHPLDRPEPNRDFGWTRSDGEGRFRLRLAPGRYKVEAHRGDVPVGTAGVTVVENEETSLDLKLP
jgi:hypothetical protein